MMSPKAERENGRRARVNIQLKVTMQVRSRPSSSLEDVQTMKRTQPRKPWRMILKSSESELMDVEELVDHPRTGKETWLVRVLSASGFTEGEGS